MSLSLGSVSAFDDNIENDLTDSYNNYNLDSKIVSESNSPDTDDTDDGKFSTLQEKINKLKEGETLYLNNDYLDNDLDNGITISKNIIIEGNGYKIDAAYKSRIFTITNFSSISLNNIVFMNGYSKDNGGAIYFDKISNSTFNNLSFMNNHADNHGAAIYVDSETSFNQFHNITLKNNTALRGAGIYFGGDVSNNSLDFYASQNSIQNFSGAVFYVGSNFRNNNLTGRYIDNHADDHCAGVLYIKGNITNNIFDGYFENNTGKAQTGGVFTLMENAINNTFKGKFYNNSARIGGVIYFYIASYNNTIMGEFIDNTASKSGSAIYFRGSPSNTIVNSTFIDNKALSIDLNIAFTDSSAKVIFTGWNNIINAINAADMANLQFNNVTYWGADGLINTDDIYPIFGPYCSGQNITVEIYKNSQLIHNITNLTNVNGAAVFYYPKLDDGTYSYLIYHGDNSYYTYIQKSGTVIIGQKPTKLSLANKKTTYNTGKYPIITLKDKNNNILKNMKITVILNGKKSTKTTDNKGQVKLTGLAPKTYKITINFNGNEKYLNSSLSTKISVLKANSKIVAKNGIYYSIAKHKRYLVALKNNKNKAIKNSKISLIINKKTFTSKTNSKGIATFKLDKFVKKGTFISLIKFAGNNYFKPSKKKIYLAFI